MPIPASSPLTIEPPRAESAWLVASFRSGDDAAATALFERYFARLTALVQSRLGARLRARVDPDDVALSAYRSFFVRAAAGQFELCETGDLWRLLARMALHKLSHQIDRHTAEKRAVSMEEQLSDSHDLASAEPSPDEAAAISDELEFVMRSLDETERRTLELRLQGELIEAIAAELRQSERTVRRTLARVREVMLKRLPDAVAERRTEAILAPSPRREGSGRGEADEPAVALDGDDLNQRDSAHRDFDQRRLPSPTLPAEGWEFKRSGVSESDRPLPCHHFQNTSSEPTLFDHTDFLLKQYIGEGLTGKVYRAWWKSRSRTVAVKYLKRSHLEHPDRVARFCDEAAVIAGFAHPNIVALHGLGRALHGGYFIVFDWIDGPNLQTLLERSTQLADGHSCLSSSLSNQSRMGRSAHPPTARLSINDITHWLSDAALAIEYAHARGVVHCDLKPGNLLLAPAGQVLLTDFGFARQLTSSDDGLPSGGTLAFMAPEQLDPSFGEIGPHTDIYGWGAVLYALLTGQPPHLEQRPADLLDTFQPGRGPAPRSELRPDVPDKLAAVCDACLQPNPLARPLLGWVLDEVQSNA